MTLIILEAVVTACVALITISLVDVLHSVSKHRGAQALSILKHAGLLDVDGDE